MTSRKFDVTPLDKLHLTQKLGDLSLPIFIPDQTYNLPNHVNLNCEWVALSLKQLIRQRGSSLAQPHTLLTSPSLIRRRARVNKNSRLIAILNGTDDLLESFWGMERIELYKALTVANIDGITGPTFSIYKYLSEKNKLRIPDSHSVMMLNRHHRVMSELTEHFRFSIPNIYWRNSKDLDKWKEWLLRNEKVSYIYKDFSATKGKDYEQFLYSLSNLVSVVNRPFHLLVTGIGCARAAIVIKHFADIGCRTSIISADPILKGMKNKALIYKGENSPDIIPSPNQKLYEIAVENVYVMEQHLRAVTHGLSIYNK